MNRLMIVTLVSNFHYMEPEVLGIAGNLRGVRELIQTNIGTEEVVPPLEGFFDEKKKYKSALYQAEYFWKEYDVIS